MCVQNRAASEGCVCYRALCNRVCVHVKQSTEQKVGDCDVIQAHNSCLHFSNSAYIFLIEITHPHVTPYLDYEVVIPFKSEPTSSSAN